MKFEYRTVKDPEEKLRFMRECDDVFTISVTGREFFDSLFAKIDRYAVFIGVYAEDNETAGYAAIYANDEVNKTAYITLFCIRKQMQRQHLGSGLMDACVEQARKRGMNVIRLEVLKRDAGAIAFYMRNGFMIESAADDAEESDSYYMSRRL